MKKSDYKYFYHYDYLDSDLHDQVLTSGSLNWDKGILVDRDGSVSPTDDLILKNRCLNDDSIFMQHLSQPMFSTVDIVKRSLIDFGAKNPIAFNIGTLTNPSPTPGSKAHGWHKDFNIVEHINDETKLWIVMLIFTNESVNSKLTVSPTPEGPKLWNIGFDAELKSNFMMAHSINLGHHYIPGSKNQLKLVYMRFYDPS